MRICKKIHIGSVCLSINVTFAEVVGGSRSVEITLKNLICIEACLLCYYLMKI